MAGHNRTNAAALRCDLKRGDLWSNDLSAHALRELKLVADSLRHCRALASAQYLLLEAMTNFGKPGHRSIDRMQMQLVVSRVSAINQCFY